MSTTTGVAEDLMEHAISLRELIEEMQRRTAEALELLEGIEARIELD